MPRLQFMKDDFAGKQYLRPSLPPTPSGVWWAVGALNGALLLIAVLQAGGYFS